MTSTDHLLAMLGSAGAHNNADTNNRNANEPLAPLVTLKAGKMSTSLLENGKYNIVPEVERGQIEISKSSDSNGIKLLWRNRRTKEATDADTLTLYETDQCKFQKVNESSRVYVLTVGAGGDAWHFYWLQDVNEEHDLKLTREVASLVSFKSDLVKPSSAPESGNGASSSSSNAAANADALSSILDSLASNAPPASSSNTNAVASSNNATEASSQQRELTLADLQGAMEGLATSSPPVALPAVTAAPLTEVVTADHVTESGILEDPEVSARLMELLPENQRTEESLREHLSAPQVKQALASLSNALSNVGTFHSVVMNFQLEPRDGMVSLQNGNPIQAFLDCLIAKVESENNDDDAANAEEKEGTE